MQTMVRNKHCVSFQAAAPPHHQTPPPPPPSPQCQPSSPTRNPMSSLSSPSSPQPIPILPTPYHPPPPPSAYSPLLAAAMAYISQTSNTKRKSLTKTLLFTCAILSTVIFIIRNSIKPSAFLSKNHRYPHHHQFLDAHTWNNHHARHVLATLTSDLLPSRPAAAAQDVCLLVAADPEAPDLWRLNSRSLCITSPLCLPLHPSSSDNQVMHTSDFKASTCRLVTPEFDALPPPLDDAQVIDSSSLSCYAVHSRYMLCPIPNGSRGRPKKGCVSKNPTPPKKMARLMDESRDAGLLMEGITIIVPRYAYPGNIFHFSASLAMVSHVASNIETILSHYGHAKLKPSNATSQFPLNVVFFGNVSQPWQKSFEKILLSGQMSYAVKRGLRVHYLPHLKEMHGRESHVCVKNPISLGQRGHVNAWPFPNATSLRLDGSQVPRHAVHLKHDMYDKIGILPAPLVEDAHGIQRIPVPPLVLGYSRRAGRGSVVGNGIHAAGAVRRFSDADEQWFGDMLVNETDAARIQLTTFITSGEEPFEDQVKNMAGIGFVVGIHGANLANNLFMRPFGMLFEIFPANMTSHCYVAGGNSGLAYMSHHAIVPASAEESGCGPHEPKCHLLTRQRMVKIGSDEDRINIRYKVRKGIRHIVRLNEAYGDKGGVPVVYDRLNGVYNMYDEE